MNCRKRKGLVRCEAGLETVTGVFMLLLMLAALTGMVTMFYSSSISTQKQMSTEQARSQEQIVLTNQVNEGTSAKATIANTGTVEVNIKALYILQDSQITHYYDPSTTPGVTTYIQPSKSITLSFPDGVMLNQNEKIVAATERGVRTVDNYQPPPKPTPSFSHNPNIFVYGDLELEWRDFSYQPVTKLPPPNNWDDGWVVPPKTEVIWRVVITNIGEKIITINEKSSFVTVPNGVPGHPSSPSNLLSWYLYTDKAGDPQELTLGKLQPTEVLFMWTIPGGQADHYVSTYSSPCVAMAFLTFFGNKLNNDGSIFSPYAQTVPFEAAITIS